MQIREIRQLSDDELIDAVEDKKEEMWILRRDRVTGELTDTNAIRNNRRVIARLKTVLRERQLAAAMMASKESE